MSLKSMRLQLGLVVMGGALLLGFMIILFGSMPRFWEKGVSYIARFKDAPGIASGTPVRRSGVRVGQVTFIELEEETGEVMVHFALSNPFKLRMHERPTLTTGLLANDAAIDLLPEDPLEGKSIDRSLVDVGAIVEGRRAATVNSLLQGASAVVPSTQEALEEMRRSLRNLEKLSPLLQDSLKEVRDVARSVREVIPDIKDGALATMKEYRKLGETANDILPKFQKKFEDGVGDIQKTANAATATFKDIEGISKQFSLVAKQIGSTAEKIDNFIGANQDKLGKTIDLTNETINRVGNILGNDNQKQFNAILKNTKTASDRFDGMAQNLMETSKDIADAVRWFNRFTAHMDEAADPSQRRARPAPNQTAPLIPGGGHSNSGFPGNRSIALAFPNHQTIVASSAKPIPQFSPQGGVPAISTSQSTPLPATGIPPQPGPGLASPSPASPSSSGAGGPSLQGQPLNPGSTPPRPLPGNPSLPPTDPRFGISGARVGMLLRDLDETIVGVQDFTLEIKALFKNLVDGDGALRKFLNDPTIYYRIDQILSGVNQQIPAIGRILNNVEIFADKLARHPESLGLGGVVRPGSGIKDSPPSNGGLRMPR